MTSDTGRTSHRARSLGRAAWRHRMVAVLLAAALILQAARSTRDWIQPGRALDFRLRAEARSRSPEQHLRWNLGRYDSLYPDIQDHVPKGAQVACVVPRDRKPRTLRPLRHALYPTRLLSISGREAVPDPKAFVSLRGQADLFVVDCLPASDIEWEAAFELIARRPSYSLWRLQGAVR